MEPDTLPILIVEDDLPTQSLLRTVLVRGGYASEVASNGREAIALLHTKRYAAVLLDIMMPGVSGDQVIAFLVSTSNAVPVIICSAAGKAALTGLDPAVVKAIVRKPFDIDELLTAIANVTDTGTS